jgi:ribosomal protein S27AE
MCQAGGGVLHLKEDSMSSQNRYCCRCHQTTRFEAGEARLTCSRCGVIVEVSKQPRAEAKQERVLIGDPMRSYKTSFAA